MGAPRSIIKWKNVDSEFPARLFLSCYDLMGVNSKKHNGNCVLIIVEIGIFSFFSLNVSLSGGLLTFQQLA